MTRKELSSEKKSKSKQMDRAPGHRERSAGQHLKNKGLYGRVKALLKLKWEFFAYEVNTSENEDSETAPE